MATPRLVHPNACGAGARAASELHSWRTGQRIRGFEVTEVGKAAKRMGHQHPSVLRRTDAKPERPTPKAKPHRKAQKPYGYSYEDSWFWRPGDQWKRRYVWCATERARDQALADYRKKTAGLKSYRDVRPETVSEGNL